MADFWAAHAEERLAAGPRRTDAGLALEGLALFHQRRALDPQKCCCSPISTPATCCQENAVPGYSSIQSYVGDSHYDVLQHLLNCNGSLQADPIRLLTEVADLAGLEAGRVQQWLFARCVLEILGDGVPWPGLDVVLRRLGSP